MNKNDSHADFDAPILDGGAGAIAQFVARARRRGHITVDELDAALPQDQMTNDQIEAIMSALSEMGVKIVENDEADDGSADQADTQKEDEGDPENEPDDSGDISERRVPDTKKAENLGRTDDPVRMYLREMGAVEMLSREGEAAIAKRIEAGRDMMIQGLCESPLTFHAIIEWSEALNSGDMQLREILDLEAMFSKEPAPESLSEDGEGGDAEISEKTAGPSFKEEDDVEEAGDEVTENGDPLRKREADDEDDGNSLSLAQLEAALRPEALEKFQLITELFQVFECLQFERLDMMGLGIDFSTAKEEQYQQLLQDLTAQVEAVKFHATKIEYLIDNLYSFNRRLTTPRRADASPRRASQGQACRLPRRIRWPRTGRHLAFGDCEEGQEVGRVRCI